jgi:hypothetical protein
MFRLISTLALVSLVTMLTGCALEHTSLESKALASIPDKSSKILVGKASREAVHGELGKPLYSSKYWGFDLFRDEASQSQTAYAITPWPIPFAHLTDDLRRYTLITYDASNHVSSLKSDIFRKVPNWRSGSPIQNDYLSLRISGDGVTLLLDRGVSGENLLVAGVNRDAYFKRLGTSPTCTMVVGAGSRSFSRGLGIKLSVDGGKRLSLLMHIPENHGDETLVAIKLAAGDHDLVFSSKYVDGNTIQKLACQPGDVKYLQVGTTGTAKDKTIAWEVDQWDAMPSDFVERPLVLVYDGEWQVEVEPYE